MIPEDIKRILEEAIEKALDEKMRVFESALWGNGYRIITHEDWPKDVIGFISWENIVKK